MSFGQQVKNELCKIAKKEPPRNEKALLYGLLLFSHSFGNSIRIRTQNENIAKLYQALLKSVCGLDLEIQNGTGKRHFHIISVADKKQVQKILSVFGHGNPELFLRIHWENLKKKEYPAFVRGAYLACGGAADPEKDYRVEFLAGYSHLCADLAELLGKMGVTARLAAKKSGAASVYIKDSQAVEDLLALMGATKAAFAIMNVQAIKDIRNNTNRRTNFETANIGKTAIAAAEQLDSIKLIYGLKGENFLSGDLANAARLRLENPEASLAELSELSSPPLTRSSLNRRFAKIRAIAENLRADGGNRQAKGLIIK